MAFLHKNFTGHNFEMTMTRKQLQDFCSTKDFPTATVGKNWKGVEVLYAYCPICKIECEERNNRRTNQGKFQRSFNPSTAMQSSDIIIHMAEKPPSGHGLPMIQILQWVKPPEIDPETGEKFEQTREELFEVLLVMVEFGAKSTNAAADRKTYTI